MITAKICIMKILMFGIQMPIGFYLQPLKIKDVK